MKKIISLLLCVILLICSIMCVTASAKTHEQIAEEIVEIARAEVGYFGEGSNKFNEWYYGSPSTAAWCAIFISWCADRVGVLNTAIPKRALCSDMLNWFDSNGRYYSIDSGYVPQKGDIVFLDTDGSGVTHHVEFIAENGFKTAEDGTVYIHCIGGNTSDANFNGVDHVTERERAISDERAVVMGFAHPDYEKEKTNVFASLLENLRAFFEKIIEFFRNLFS